MAPDAAGRPGEALEATLIALGFQPTARPHEGDGLTFCLGNCPYSAAVTENQPAVCTLHKGITLGLLDVLDPGARLATFEPHDPVQAGCVIEVRT